MGFELQGLADARLREAKRLQGSCLVWAAYAFTAADVLSHLVVMSAAWSSTAYVILIYLGLHVAMAAVLTSPKQALLAPLTWLVPRGGTWIRPGPSRNGAGYFYLVSYALRLVLLRCLHLASKSEANVPLAINCEYGVASQHCEGLPRWLVEGWWSSPTCYADPQTYEQCFQRPWYLQGKCNVEAAQCRMKRGLSHGVVQILFWMVISAPVMGTIVSLILLLYLNRYTILFPGRPVPVEAPQAVTCTQKAKVVKDIFFFLLDIASDVNGVYQFLYTGNFMFAACSGAIFLLSFGQQLADGSLRAFPRACKESLNFGTLSDGLRRIMLTEKSVEAPLQLLLQYYAYLFMTSSDFAMISFGLSMCLSCYSVTEAAFSLVQLDLMPAIQDYALPEASDGESSSGSSKICGF